MASGPITSWQIDGETMEKVRDFIFLCPKITADGDYSYEIKKQLLRGRNAMTNLDNILKSITLLTKVCIVRATGFSGRRKWQTTPVFLPKEPCGQRSMVGCRLWGHRVRHDWSNLACMHACIGGGNGNPLQHSCLENPRDGGVWWAAIYGVAQSSQLSSSRRGNLLRRCTSALHKVI